MCVSILLLHYIELVRTYTQEKYHFKPFKLTQWGNNSFEYFLTVNIVIPIIAIKAFGHIIMAHFCWRRVVRNTHACHESS